MSVPAAHPWPALLAPAAVAPRAAEPARRPSRAERRLAARLRDGDPEALRQIHADHGRWVHGLLQRALGDGAEAEDVFQVVMTEVWRRGAQYDPERASLGSWIATIARSRAIDALRRRRDVPVDPQALPEAAREDAELDALLDRWHLGALVARLSDDEQAVLRLRFEQGLTQTQIASRLAVPLGTVKTRMVRGLERLEGFLEAERRHDAARLPHAAPVKVAP